MISRCTLTTVAPVDKTTPQMYRVTTETVKVRIDFRDIKRLDEMGIICHHELVKLWFMHIFCNHCGLIFEANRLASSVEYIPEPISHWVHPVDSGITDQIYKFSFVPQTLIDVLIYQFANYLPNIDIPKS